MNVPFMEIPIFERHLANYMFRMTVGSLNIYIYPTCRDVLIAVSYDGDQSTTRIIRGLITYINRVASPGFTFV